MKNKKIFFIPIAYTQTEIERLYQNDKEQLSFEEIIAKKFNKYAEANIETKIEMALLEEKIYSGKYSNKEIIVFEKIRKDEILNNSERKIKERLIKKLKKEYDVI